jgi:PAS domain S-box-containing protein
MKIQTRSLLWMLIPLLVSLLLLDGIFYWMSSSLAEKQTAAMVQSEAQRVDAELRSRLKRAASDLAILVSNRTITEYFMYSQTGVLDRAEDARWKIEEDILRIVQRKPEYEAVRLAGLDGKTVVDVIDAKTSFAHFDVSDADWFRNASQLELGQPHVTSLHLCMEHGQPGLALAMPCFGQVDRKSGVASLHMHVQDFFRESLEQSIGRNGYAYLVDAGGVVVAHKNPAKIGAAVNELDSTRKLLAGETGTASERDEAEGALLAKAYLPTEIDGLGLVVALPQSEASAFGRQLQLFNILLILFTLAVVTAVGALSVRRIVRPIEKLADGAKQLAQGNLAARVEFLGEDEIGSVCSAFNEMADRVCESIERLSRQEARTRTILDSTADGILAVGEDGTILSTNAAAEKLFGYEADQMVGHNVSMLVPALNWKPDDEHGDVVLPASESRMIGGETEAEGHHQDGHEIPVALRVTEMNYHGELVYIATLQDISERRRAEADRERMFQGIREAVGRLSSASEELLAATKQHAVGIGQQAASVSETVATLDELGQTAEQAKERAEAVADSARRVDEVSHAGRKAVDATMTAMRAVREQAETVAENIIALAERAQAISEIIATVTDIAEQTNVLALNAAIEAARSGEHGKGFAVVAAEVKALAEQAKIATDQISRILGEIQQATNAAVLSTEQGMQSVGEASAVVTQAESAITALSETIADTARAASAIVATVGQQAMGMNQITDAMVQINQATHHAQGSTEQVEHLARDLTELGNRLKRLIEGNNRSAP